MTQREAEAVQIARDWLGKSAVESGDEKGWRIGTGSYGESYYLYNGSEMILYVEALFEKTFKDIPFPPNIESPGVCIVEKQGPLEGRG